jgi:hypothetical protein
LKALHREIDSLILLAQLELYGITISQSLGLKEHIDIRRREAFLLTLDSLGQQILLPSTDDSAYGPHTWQYTYHDTARPNLNKN